MSENSASFEIKEDFSELKEKLARSIKDGLISQLAADDGYFDSLYKEDLYIRTYTEEDYWHDFDRGTTTEAKFILLDENKISLGYYETWSLGVDTCGNDVSDDDNDRAVTIQSKENGGCIVSGDIEILENLKEFRDIFAGVRNEITYVPGTLNNGNENKLLEDEKYKINGLQDYKNKIKGNYERVQGFDIDKVLRAIDPSGSVTGGDFDSAVWSPDARMDGPRKDARINLEPLYPDSEDLGISVFVHDPSLDEETWATAIWGEKTTTVPEDWSEYQAGKYFTMRYEGHPVSEKMYDSYLQSDKAYFEDFLKQVVKEFLKNKNKGLSREENLDATLTLLNAKNRVKQSLEKNKEITPEIKDGIAKTKESGYKHISRTPAANKGREN